MKTAHNIEFCLPKSVLILRSLLIVSCLVLASGLKAQTPTTLLVNDTRSGDSLPSAYKHVARFDFKYRSVIHAPGTGVYDGLLVFAPWSDASGGLVYQMDFNPSGLYFRTGNYTTETWGYWSKLVMENSSGLTSLGNGSPTSGLNVNGDIKAREVNVTTTAWPDDVFDKHYELPLLSKLEKKIHQLGHLPGVPEAEKVTAEGIDLGEMNMTLLRKVEELTLYIINQDKRIGQLEKSIKLSQK